MTSKAMAPNEAPKAAKVQECDVVILGSGLGGSITGAILARQGAKVVLIDAGQHPRFAVGESQNPQLVEWLHLLAVRFDVPEIKHLLDVKAITDNLGPSHGKKQSFGFVKHKKGQEPDPREANMFIIPKMLTEASHMFRQDTDSYYLNVAAKYGCTLRQNWRATDLDFDEDGVNVTGQNGEVFRAKFLIDASGFRSPLAEKFDLRENPPRHKHHSRSLFTHYVGIKPYDDVNNYPEALQPPAPFNGGTLHHLIERGWFWIIPFNNYKDSKNPVCSVGLTFDERLYPKPKDMTPDEEFNMYLDQYPAVKRQFEGAKRVREWVSTDRIQYSSKQTIGHRWCLMSHAAGFIDPLYSRGLSNTFEVVDALVSRVLESLKDDDFSVERYEYVERLEQGLLHYNDELVNASYNSFSHYRLWNAVFRVWGCFTTPATIRMLRARQNFLIDGDDRHFKEMEESRFPGLWWPDSTGFKHLLDVTAETCEKYEAGVLDGDTAADIVFKAIRDCDVVVTPFGWKDDEDHRYFLPSTATMMKFMYWANVQAPPEMRPIGRALLSGIVKSGAKGKKAT
ncbi:FADH2 O2-dependent halogenase [Kitasatospora sp. MAA4]|uniref:NAD(P)/FAD-dependent oxidoreductase n=1 Tax=Kitasatospora sp. MAA4 TaxID=3035093 RepID=UPI00247507F3|nr:tryptophan 7-halogenase [Kitasatospora sp. MAA4]MDH6132649.1 FADH2 O2-dependent halogenase [Kitasatospora sp. MAA4]